MITMKMILVMKMCGHKRVEIMIMMRTRMRMGMRMTMKIGMKLMMKIRTRIG